MNKPLDGRLQTAEHILARILENRISDAETGISKFKEDKGTLEISTTEDLREFDREKIQSAVNKIVESEIPVNKYVKNRGDAQREVDLKKVPSDVQKIRIVDIEGFDKRPCKDPHVDNTKEIGKFEILKIKRVGRDRYRITFTVN